MANEPAKAGSIGRIGWRLPVLASLRGYERSWLRGDIAAGFAVAAVGLPSAIAYPAIVGLPPETGIYASIAPLVAYAVLGPSKQLIVGPDAATMTVLAAALAAAVPPTMTDAGDRVVVAAAMGFAVGIICLFARLLKLGVVANFLSRPILIGFFAGVSLSILIGQLGRVTGVKIEASGLVAPVVELVRHIGAVHWPTVALALAMFLLLQAARFWKFPLPGPVMVVVISATLSAIFDFQGRGIAVVGDIPAALPALALPQLGLVPFQPLILGAAAVFLVSFGSGVITAQSFGMRGGYSVDPNGELVGFGAANVAAGLFGAFPVSGSDSRTAVNLAVGGRTQLVSLVAAGVLAAAVLLIAPVLRIIPIPALGAILVATAIGMIDVSSLRRIWSISRVEFAFALTALCGPIWLGVLNGVVIAIGATLAYVIQKLMYPRDAVLGRLPGHDGFFKLHRAEGARPIPGMTICLIQGSVLFCNANYVKDRLAAIVDAASVDTRWLILDAGSIPQIDVSGADMLDAFHGAMERRGIAVGLVELHAEVMSILDRAGVIQRIGRDMVFDNLEEAVAAFSVRRLA